MACGAPVDWHQCTGQSSAARTHGAGTSTASAGASARVRTEVRTPSAGARNKEKIEMKDDELDLLQNAEFKEAFDEFDQVKQNLVIVRESYLTWDLGNSVKCHTAP